MFKSNLSLIEVSVKRPILIAVVNIIIVIMGLSAFLGVDIRELPDVDRPVVSVVANYQGASPETVDTDLTSIIEGSVARISGVENITSSSEEGNTRIRIEFGVNTDLNSAANDVREAVSRVQRKLPSEVQNLSVIKADNNARSIMSLAIYSDQLANSDLATRIEKDIAPSLLSIDGIADVQISGNRASEIRVLLDSDKLASLRIPISDIVSTLKTARFDVPVGSYQSSAQELIVRTFASAVDISAIANLQIKNNTRIKDIAEVILTPQEVSSYSLLNGRMVISLDIVRQAGANTIAISNAVKQKVAELNSLSKNLTIHITTDDAKYIEGALKEVAFTLMFSVVVVLFVIALFLGELKTTLIPAITIPISLIGTIALIWVFGFSINLLTLLALVLATGLIVDDAIVVLENIQRAKKSGVKSMAAAVLGTNQVFFAVIATTITLASVFIPIIFLPGETGRLFTEFGLVLVIAVLISSFVALTLCPMMASKLQETKKPSLLAQSINRHLAKVGSLFVNFYLITLQFILKFKFTTLFFAIAIALLGYLGFKNLNQELSPKEDRGAIMIFLTGPDGSTLSYMDSQSQIVEQTLSEYQNQGLIVDIFSIVGRWDKNRVFMVATLEDFATRKISQMDLASQISKKVSNITGAQVRVFQTSSLGWRAARGGIDIALLGNDYNELANYSDKLSKELEDKIPEINNVRVNFNTSQPQLSFNINREKANDLNVPIERISQSLQVMVNQMSVIDLSIQDQNIPIVLAPKNEIDANQLLNIFITNTNNQLIPLSSLINVKETGVAGQLDRFAQRRAININLGIQSGVPLGDIIKKVKQTANQVLPSSMNIVFLGDAATLEKTQNDMAITFFIAIVIVFLVLAAQFESFGSALIVIFITPFGLAAAVFTLHLTGQSLNLYSQIGFILLIGLMTKNAILLVEFMDQMRDKGMGVMDSIFEGAKVRLRPILMTVLSTIFGALPLILSSGAGSEARSAIGWVIFGGLGISTLFTLYLTPLGYLFLAPFVKPRTHFAKELEKQLENVDYKN